MAPNEPLIVDLYFDAGEKTQTAGFQMFGLRMELEAAFIKADSVDTVFPIGLTNSVLEEGRMSDWEYLEELAPCAEDLLQLRTEGVTVPENGAHHVQFNLIADLGHSHLVRQCHESRAHCAS